MHVTVYRVRQRGIRLPVPQRGVSGQLQLQPWRDGFSQPSLKATLVSVDDAHRQLLPELYFARVARISAAGGLMITGKEIIPRRTNNKSAADHYRQTWWCLVHTVWVAEALDMVDFDEDFKPIIRPP